jgi:hypothetical protein
MSVNQEPWNGPDIFAEPKFAKGSEVRIRSTKFVGIVRNSEKRVPRYTEFLYRVQLENGFSMFFENELEHA